MSSIFKDSGASHTTGEGFHVNSSWTHHVFETLCFVSRGQRPLGRSPSRSCAVARLMRRSLTFGVPSFALHALAQEKCFFLPYFFNLQGTGALILLRRTHPYVGK